MPENVGSATTGVPIAPNAGGVEETVQRERPPTAEQAEREVAEAESNRRTEEAASQEAQVGRTVNETV